MKELRIKDFASIPQEWNQSIVTILAFSNPEKAQTIRDRDPKFWNNHIKLRSGKGDKFLLQKEASILFILHHKSGIIFPVITRNLDVYLSKDLVLKKLRLILY